MSVIQHERSEGQRGHGPALPRVNAAYRTQIRFDDSIDVGALARAYLGEPEAAAFDTMVGRSRIPWLLGRVAAKDAVRGHLASRDFAEVDPTRIIVRNDSDGCPNVVVRGARFATRGVEVSIAHKPNVAVAIAARVRQPATPKRNGLVPTGIGIDIESVEPRPASFEATVLSPSERWLFDADRTDRADRHDRDHRDAWLTRLWAVKEATAKATGLGLRGRPKDFGVDHIEDNRLRCCGRWIATAPLDTGDGRYIIAWTDSD